MTSPKKIKIKEHSWIPVYDHSLSKMILAAFGDDDKKEILITTINDPKAISGILDVCKIPQSSGYRKINSLIHEGLLIPNGYAYSLDGKKITKYLSTFENLKIEIVKNKVIVKVKLNSLVEESYPKIIQNLLQIKAN